MTNREIDALVAEKVMGWTHHVTPMGRVWHRHDGDPHSNAYVGDDEAIPHYTEIISATWLIVEKFHWFALTKHTYERGIEYEASFPPRPVEPSRANTAPLAICLAALKAVGVKVE